MSVTGTLVDNNGNDTGVKLQIRSGGPAVGFQTVTSQLYADDNILLGYVYTDEAIQNSAKFPTVAIERGFEKNPQMIMWDPATYPDVKTIADLGKTKAHRPLLQRRGRTWTTSPRPGILNKDQVDGSLRRHAGGCSSPTRARPPSRASARPSRTSTRTRCTDWGKPVAYSYINDAGWDNYAESIATKPENITKYADCFKKLVPMIQQSSVDYLKDPTKANKIILDAVAKFNNGWVYSQGVADYAVADDQEGRPGGQRSRRRDRQVRPDPGQRPDHEGDPRLHGARQRAEVRPEGRRTSSPTSSSTRRSA